jgi:hypothetical protein
MRKTKLPRALIVESFLARTILDGY